MRICLFGQGPLCEAVEAALEAQGHTLLGPYATPQPMELLKGTQASVGLSCGYRHKLRKEEWECFPDGILNLHTGYLPWNKGAYPNVWPILDGSPAGVTLHRVDEGWDTGPILCQWQTDVWPTDTAKSLYDKLLTAATCMVVDAFKHNPIGFPPGIPQDTNAGSRHTKRDWDNLCDNSARIAPYDEMLKRLRAATFTGYGLRYRQDGKLIEATITLKEVTE